MIIRADARRIPLRDGCVQTVVTSPPYWGLRDYGTARWEGGDDGCDHSAPYEAGRSTNKANSTTHPGRFVDCACGARRIDQQIGLERTPDEYVATMVQVFREVRRVLRDDGVCWLNLGDTYASFRDGRCVANTVANGNLRSAPESGARNRSAESFAGTFLKHKDLCMIPARVALALQADGWYLRSDIIWAKSNPMPESVTDRPTRSHEYIFLLAKSERYFYDADAIREPYRREWDETNGGSWAHASRTDETALTEGAASIHRGNGYPLPNRGGANKRDVWTVNSEPTPEAHFATFPQKLIEPCILAGTSEKGCCAQCGAPWVRVTEDSPEYAAFKNGRGAMRRSDLEGYGLTRGTSNPSVSKSVITKGWRPTCSHDAPVAPCLVLDPFLGSGTTGKVCERLGRRWVGLELSEPYTGIARKRTAQRGLFA